MGFLRKLKESFNGGRQRAIDESYRRRKKDEKVDIPVELVQPNEDRFVTLKITKVKDESLKKIYVEQLRAYARAIKNIYPDTVITTYNDRIKLEMSSEEEAERIRSSWKSHL